MASDPSSSSPPEASRSTTVLAQPSTSSSTAHSHHPTASSRSSLRRGGKQPSPSAPHLADAADTPAPWYRIAHLLENKGSVARDHLASERTYLAWLRTSLSLASIGIAITQLFRLGATPNTQPSARSASLAFQNSDSLLASFQSGDVATLEALKSLVLEQQRRLELLEGDVGNDPAKYRHLGKPVGGTFIVLALVFLVLGTRRYFKVQNALMHSPSKFPPSRRSVAFATLTVGMIVIAGFTAIMTTK